MAGPPLLKVRNLRFRYLPDCPFDLRVPRLVLRQGERLGLYGPSGCGKSTLGFVLAGLLPDAEVGILEGEVRLAGRPLGSYGRKEISSMVGYLFQDPASQLFHPRAIGDVCFGPQNLGLPRETIVRRVRSLLDRLGIAALADRSPDEMSGGQCQLFALASVLAMEPALLILDEPVSELDPANARLVMATIDRLARDRAVLLIDHDVGRLRSCDRVAAFRDGVVGEPVTPAELFGPPGAGPGPPSGSGRPAGAGTRADGHRASRGRGPPTAEPLLEVRGLSHAYRGRPPTFRGLNLSIRQGELAVLVGPNGAGKSTLCLACAGLLREGVAGEVVLAGREVRSMTPRERSRKVAVVFQDPGTMFFEDDVAGEIALGARLRGENRRQAERRAAAAAAEAGLSGRLNSHPFHLSRGEKQRLAIALAFEAGPDLYVLDEPWKGLDAGARDALVARLRRRIDAGAAALVATNNLSVLDAADRVLGLAGGRLVLDAPAREVVQRGLAERLFSWDDQRAGRRAA